MAAVLAQNSTLKSLKYAPLRAGDGALVALIPDATAATCARWPRSLTMNSIELDGCNALAEALMVNSTLTELK